MCGVDVLDKGCGGIHVQAYVGCRVFEVVKAYLCVSVPVLDDDCGAFVCLVYDDSIMDDKLFRACMYVVLCLGFSGICNVLSTSSSTFTWCMWLWWYCCWCVWLVFAGGWLFFV